MEPLWAHHQTWTSRTSAVEGPFGVWRSGLGYLFGVSVRGASRLTLALFEPVAITVHFEGVDVVGEPVEERAVSAFSMMDFAIAVSALYAALFWFLSAITTLPPMKAYWDEAPPDDPYTVVVKRAARLNTWAAGFTSLSAVLAFLKTASNL